MFINMLYYLYKYIIFKEDIMSKTYRGSSMRYYIFMKISLWLCILCLVSCAIIRDIVPFVLLTFLVFMAFLVKGIAFLDYGFHKVVVVKDDTCLCVYKSYISAEDYERYDTALKECVLSLDAELSNVAINLLGDLHSSRDDGYLKGKIDWLCEQFVY